MIKRRTLAVLGLLAALTLAACGSSESESGPTTLRWFTFNEPGGSFVHAAETCSEQSNGRYQIVIDEVPGNPEDQRTQLVRRLAAEDSSIDIMFLDVIFTAEFAEAGWILPWPEDVADQIRQEAIESTVESGTYEGELYAAPLNANTQLLWYRTDRVETPPETWGEMLAMAERLGDEGTIQIQGNQAESLVVFFASLLYSAGGQILTEDGEVALGENTSQALEVMRNVATSEAADPSLPNNGEDEGRIAFQQGDSSFMVNYPFVFPSAQAEAPEIAENMGAARWPRVDPTVPSSPPLGGGNLGIGAFSEHPELAFEAAQCLRAPRNQIFATVNGGLPPVNRALYDNEEVREAYPGFADLMLESIEAATPRPQSPAYADISLAIRNTLHPLDEIQPQEDAEALREKVQQAVNSEGLL